MQGSNIPLVSRFECRDFTGLYGDKSCKSSSKFAVRSAESLTIVDLKTFCISFFSRLSRFDEALSNSEA